MSGPDAPGGLAASAPRFHHVGYAVASIADYRRDFFDALFQPDDVSEAVADPIQRVRVAFATMRGGTVIELVEPLGPGSPVDAVVGSARGGLYHLCYEVDDLDAAIARFRAARCMPLARPAPAVAFGGRRIVFLLTPQRDLIELLEASLTASGR
jgi:methylmalonyl-CoA/ethylmalonyl-CoA epimerase